MERSEKIARLKAAGANYIIGMGWYLFASSAAQVLADDSHARFLGRNYKNAVDELEELDEKSRCGRED